jgi:hypothetical protein
MSAPKALTRSQQQFLLDLYENEATSREASHPLKSRHGETAKILARRRLVALDISNTTLRHVVWLTAAGTRIASECMTTLGAAVVA